MRQQILPLLLVVLTLSACAKKSDFAGRYAKNKMGASVADIVKTQEAGKLAAANGLEADVVDIQRYSTPGQSPQTIMSKILLNNQEIPVTTQHVGTEIVTGRTTLGAHTIVFHAMCANTSCNPYYASLYIYQDNRMIIQEGVRKYFDKTRPEHVDVYQWLVPGKALPLLGQDHYDQNGMVGFLNSYAESNNYTGSGIIK